MHTAIAPEIARTPVPIAKPSLRLHYAAAALGLVIILASTALLISRYLNLREASHQLIDLVTLRRNIADATLDAQVNWITEHSETLAEKNAISLRLAAGKITREEHDSMLSAAQSHLAELDDRRTVYTDLAARNASLSKQESAARDQYTTQRLWFKYVLLASVPIGLIGAALFTLALTLILLPRFTRPDPEPFNPHHQPLPHARPRALA